MLLLLESYAKYKEEGLTETKNIINFTKEYKDSNDIYLQYSNEKLEKADSHIFTSVIYEDFKSWFEKNNPKKAPPSYKIFIVGMRRHYTVKKVRIDDYSASGIPNTCFKTKKK